MKKIRFPQYRMFLLTIAVSIFFFKFWGWTGPGETLHFMWQDFLYSFRTDTGGVVPDVVIVAVDEPSFREMGLKWPWPRRLHGQVVETLALAGARAVIFDMLFSEPSRDPEDDRLFAAALENAGNVSLGKYSSQTQRDNYTQIITVEPIPILMQAAAQTGFVNQFPDNDGIVRFAYKHLDDAPSLSYSGCLAGSNETVSCTDCTDEKFLIDFKPSATHIPVISYYQVLNGLVADEFFRDKYVFIGLGSGVKVDAQGAVDAFPTPFFRFKKEMMYGVEIHANALVTLLTGCRLSLFHVPAASVLMFVISIAPFWIRKKPLLLACAGVGGAVGFGGISMALFNFQGLVMDIGPVVLATFVNTLILGLNEFRQSHKERRYIKQAFESYVASDIVKMLIDDPSALALGGQRKDLTVMFTDINGFTTISESMEPEDLVSALNDYLEFISGVIIENKGTLDKYIGDAVMAFFGSPVHFDDHAVKGCAAALSLDSQLNRPETNPEDSVFKGVTIGVNSGPLIVGNVGSEKRFDYTVIGDTVNLAARLEALNKAYGTSVIIGENTRALLPEDRFLTRELDFVKVKGKLRAISIYEIMADDPVNREQILPLFAKGLAAYRAQAWQEGQALFNSILQQCPSDGPAKVFLERCRFFEQQPPPDDWDMIWEMKVK